MTARHTFDYVIEDESGERHVRYGSAISPVLTRAEEDQIARLAVEDRDADERRVGEEGPALWEQLQAADANVDRLRRDLHREADREANERRRQLYEALGGLAGTPAPARPDPAPRRGQNPDRHSHQVRQSGPDSPRRGKSGRRPALTAVEWTYVLGGGDG